MGRFGCMQYVGMLKGDGCKKGKIQMFAICMYVVLMDECMTDVSKTVCEFVYIDECSDDILTCK